MVVERSYSVRWSEELGYCLLQVLVEKAEKIAAENNGICALAFSEADSKSDLWRILEQRLGQLKKKAHLFAGEFNLPPSLNSFEYSDNLAGAKLIPSGGTVKTKLKVVLIRMED